MDAFEVYLGEINKAYGRGDATEHTHRPALKALVEGLGKNITATNEPKRQECGAPDFIVSRRLRKLDRTIGYIEAKDIDKSLAQEAKKEQVKKRYLPSLHNFIFTNYIDFRWYVDGELRESAVLAREGAGGVFVISEDGAAKVKSIFHLFFMQEAVKLKNAEALASKMASITRLMRDVIRNTFASESEQGQLHGQYESFKQILLHDLEADEFADMYAQTISYGLFAARCHINHMTAYGKDLHAAFHGVDGMGNEFSREKAAWLLPKTNPFLRKIFGDIAGPEMDDRISWLVDDLVSLLRDADMGAVLRGFAGKGKKKDPVIHFYETFLAKYDAKLRESRGVYYTPEPVVSYIVRSVDWILKDKFKMRRGLADNSKVKVDIKRQVTKKGRKKKVEEVETKEIHRCLILDPAAGTGTFLYEVIKEIHKKFVRNKGAWGGYVKEHLLPRIFGFELMMAPYAIAHMKLGLELADSGYEFDSNERLKVYLTNTLEEADENDDMPLFMFALAEEARAANEIKRDMPVMVVMGNPPYSGHSANASEREEFLLPGQTYTVQTKRGKVQKVAGDKGVKKREKTFIGKLIQDYYFVDGKPLGEKNPKWLQDDYVKFIRYGQYRIEQTGSGVLAFITNHGYLDNPTFRGMRQQLMEAFTDIYILDLHGNSKKKEVCPDGSPDKNVFDIQQGVSIGIFVKEPNNEAQAKVHHYELWGGRKSKYEWLKDNALNTTEWSELDTPKPFYLYIKQNNGNLEEYNKGFKITEIFPLNAVGFQTHRDYVVLSQDKKELMGRMSDFCDKNISDIQIREKYFSHIASKKYPKGDTRDWKLHKSRESLIKIKHIENWITKCIRRPFDFQWYFFHPDAIDYGRPTVMNNLIMNPNFALLWTRPMSPKYDFSAFTTSYAVDQSAVGNKVVGAGGTYVGPLYLYPMDKKQGLFDDDGGDWEGGVDGRVPNLDKGFVDEFAGKLGMAFVSDGKGDLKKAFGPEDLFGYIYGVFHSPTYRRRYAEFLKIDFPRVPMTGDKKLFAELSRAGSELVGLHLLESKTLGDERRYPAFDVEGGGVVESGYPSYVVEAESADKGRVYINSDQYFEGVGPEVWEFCVGGYQVCEKWLKDRRGRGLSYDDILHYQQITVALGDTIKAMGAIDEVIEGFGGWPID